jgi:DNA-binding HxlR family transcriptional regulator
MVDESEARCSTRALKVVADYWVLRIVEELDHSDGPLRFSALQRALGEPSPATLSNRLQRLEDEDLVTREEGTDGRASVAYALSEKGRRVLPIIRAIDAFAESTG